MLVHFYVNLTQKVGNCIISNVLSAKTVDDPETGKNYFGRNVHAVAFKLDQNNKIGNMRFGTSSKKIDSLIARY